MTDSQIPFQTAERVKAPVTHWFARQYLELLSNIGSALVGGGLPILLGFSPLPDSFPLVAFAQSSPQVALAIAGGLLLLLVIAVTLSLRIWGAPSGGAAVGHFLSSAMVSAVGSLAIGVLFGFNSLPSSIPLLGLIRAHPPLGIGLVALLLALLIFAPLLGLGGGGSGARADAPQRGGGSPGGGGGRRLFAATAVSTVTALLFVSLLGTVIVRPSWCPQEICPGPVTNPFGNNDGTLEIIYAATQSAFSAIPGDVASYSLARNNLPHGIGALRIDPAGGAAYTQPYRAVVGVHSLQLTPGSGLVIEQVTVVLDAVTPAPVPLNVWTPGAPNDYNHNPYLAVYHGEPAGARLVALSQHQPPTHTELGEGQSDELDIQLKATTTADIRFHVEVTYSVKGGAPLLVLSLKKHEFEVTFGDASNWNAFRLDNNGGFVPAGS